jgi:hypothetical protein
MIRYIYCKLSGNEYFKSSGLGMLDAVIDFSVFISIGLLIAWVMG